MIPQTDYPVKIQNDNQIVNKNHVNDNRTRQGVRLKLSPIGKTHAPKETTPGCLFYCRLFYASVINFSLQPIVTHFERHPSAHQEAQHHLISIGPNPSISSLSYPIPFWNRELVFSILSFFFLIFFRLRLFFEEKKTCCCCAFCNDPKGHFHFPKKIPVFILDDTVVSLFFYFGNQTLVVFYVIHFLDKFDDDVVQGLFSF